MDTAIYHSATQLLATVQAWPCRNVLFILAAVLTKVLLIHLYIDYRLFLSLGPGGTPSTPAGYAKVKCLSFVALRNPLKPLPATEKPGYLLTLPPRDKPRPQVRGIAPHRQITQRARHEQYLAVLALLNNMATSSSEAFMATSTMEHHCQALFASNPVEQTRGGEVAHAHPSEGSLHLTLHSADANLVVRMGWGERHPLAKGGWCKRFVPENFVMVYAPVDERELEVVGRIVEAADWFVRGGGRAEVLSN